jgi:hypothetical protein
MKRIETKLREVTKKREEDMVRLVQGLDRTAFSLFAPKA